LSLSISLPSVIIAMKKLEEEAALDPHADDESEGEGGDEEQEDKDEEKTPKSAKGKGK
jgi:hypothetical protein